MTSNHESSLEKPFRIEVPDQKLELLRKKLELTVLPDELEGAGHDYGVPLSDIKRLLAHWKDGYDWRKHEAKLNDELPQFTRQLEVDGFGSFTVHYVHKRSVVKNAIPLLFVHGWPGSFIEVRKILPLLTGASPEHPSFHVVAVSLPGYGFSSAPTKPGFKIHQYAELFNKLMVSLGYVEYVTQGGDWGAVITRKMAAVHGGKHVKAWHTNCPVEANTSLSARILAILYRTFVGVSPAEKARREYTALFFAKGAGYIAQQSTQPQTLGYGLADSPIGLLAWLYEKLVNWADSYNWEDDEVLTWISIYWFSHAGPAASSRIYYEAFSEVHQMMAPRIPLGHSIFAKEMIIVPLIKPLKPSTLVFEAEHSKGGHFAAYEVPDLLVGDLRKMFGKGGPAAGVVAGCGGYD